MFFIEVEKASGWQRMGTEHDARLFSPAEAMNMAFVAKPPANMRVVDQSGVIISEQVLKALV